MSSEQFAGTLEALARTDPRLDLDRVRHVTATDAHETVLVGVVHDHPSSVHRVRRIIESCTPDTVALELPQVSVPLFENYATDERTPPVFGGEMSAAIQAADDTDVVGIDAPSRSFFGALVAKFARERPGLRTVARVCRGVSAVTTHALKCRLAATVANRTSLRVEVDAPVRHDCDVTDAPHDQAANERRQAETSLSLLRATETPGPVRLRDETREECMAERIDALRVDGSVVAVVGLDHLDAIATRLGGVVDGEKSDG